MTTKYSKYSPNLTVLLKSTEALLCKFTLAASDFGEESNIGGQRFFLSAWERSTGKIMHKWHWQNPVCDTMPITFKNTILTLDVTLWKYQGHCQFGLLSAEAFVTLSQP